MCIFSTGWCLAISTTNIQEWLKQIVLSSGNFYHELAVSLVDALWMSYEPSIILFFFLELSVVYKLEQQQPQWKVQKGQFHNLIV